MRYARPALLIPAILFAPLLQAGCAEPREASASEAFYGPRGDTLPATAGVVLAGRVERFHGPESVRYDYAQDVFFVSNMMGPGSARDGEGYIARVAAGTLETIDIFIEGGRSGVTLNAPKGMALQGDTLWVADIDVIRGFHRTTGRPLRTITLPMTVTLLNDVAVSPDGTMYITDTGIEMTDKGVKKPGGDKVIALSPRGEVTVRATGTDIGWPNGVAWDAHNDRWIIVTFDPFRSMIYAMTPEAGDGVPAIPLATGPGRFDGVEVLDDGTLLVSAWNDHSLHMISPDGTDRRIVGALTQPADIGVDTRRNRVAIPQALRGVVDFWTLPGGS